MTVVINLFGAPGSGKTTAAASLWAKLKQERIKSEVCLEYVKGWAWQDRKVTNLDQYYLFGKETHHLSDLYGKVDYIICDSPLLLGNFYLHKYREDLNFEMAGPLDPAIFDFMQMSRSQGVRFFNFFVKRVKPYQEAGRYQTEGESDEISDELYHFMQNTNRTFYCPINEIIELPDAERAEYIYNYIKTNDPL